jgi:hypothetical protein
MQTPQKSHPQSVQFWLQENDQIRLVATVPRLLAPSLLAKIRASGQPCAHPNSKPVEVISVDEEKARKLLPLDAQLVRRGHVFESAFAASMTLGYGYNEVAQRLSGARRTAEIGQKEGVNEIQTVMLRGLTLRYADPAAGQIEPEITAVQN